MIDSVKPKLTVPSLSSSFTLSYTKREAIPPGISDRTSSSNLQSVSLQLPDEVDTSSLELSSSSKRLKRSFNHITEDQVEVVKEHFSKGSKPPTWAQIQSFVLNLTGNKYSQFYISSRRQEWGIPAKVGGPYLTNSKVKILKKYYYSHYDSKLILAL